MIRTHGNRFLCSCNLDLLTFSILCKIASLKHSLVEYCLKGSGPSGLKWSMLLRAGWIWRHRTWEIHFGQLGLSLLALRMLFTIAMIENVRTNLPWLACFGVMAPIQGLTITS